MLWWIYLLIHASKRGYMTKRYVSTEFHQHTIQRYHIDDEST